MQTIQKIKEKIKTSFSLGLHASPQPFDMTAYFEKN